MPNIKSAKKRVSVIARRKKENRYVKSTMATMIKNFRSLVAVDAEKAEKLLSDIVSYINSAKTKGVIHKNNASRKVARLNLLLNKAKIKENPEEEIVEKTNKPEESPIKDKPTEKSEKPEKATEKTEKTEKKPKASQAKVDEEPKKAEKAQKKEGSEKTEKPKTTVKKVASPAEKKEKPEPEKTKKTPEKKPAAKK